jgi:hypothetical protein
VCVEEVSGEACHGVSVHGGDDLVEEAYLPWSFVGGEVLVVVEEALEGGGAFGDVVFGGEGGSVLWG